LGAAHAHGHAAHDPGKRVPTFSSSSFCQHAYENRVLSTITAIVNIDRLIDGFFV
jgi:hypothetical protein